jgi:hypothetical protein
MTQISLVGVEDYPILAKSKPSVIWNAIRNGHISKARRTMSSDGVGNIGEKPIRDQKLQKYHSDPNRHVPRPIQNITNIDFTDEATHDKVKHLLFYQPNSIQGIAIIIT